VAGEKAKELEALDVDEKRLQDISGYMRSDGWYLSEDEESLELIRLARLGLWAEKHAVPLLTEISEDDTPQGDHPCFAYDADMALKALPKDKK
jgi:hypothetical protein